MSLSANEIFLGILAGIAISILFITLFIELIDLKD